MRHGFDRAQGTRLHRLAPWVLCFSVLLAPSLAAAHPTSDDLRERATRAKLCTPAENPGEPFDSVQLGAEESKLRTAWGDALQPQKIEHLGPDFQRLAQPPEVDDSNAKEGADPYADQLRLLRVLAKGDVRRVEYELFRGRVYRIRWELSDRFHAPIMDDFVHQAAHCYGPFRYDQTIEAKLGSGESTLRRAGWERNGRLLEIRQLNPLGGGPLFVTMTDRKISKAIIAARGSLAPEPNRRSEPWWQRKDSSPASPSDDERSALVRALASVLSQTGF
jgi:hypothetical protein